MNTADTTSNRPTIDISAIVARAIEVLRDPSGCWNKIKSEQTSVKELYLGYIIPLAAVGPICSWIGLMTIGLRLPLGITYRVGFFGGLVHAVVTFALMLVAMYAFAEVTKVLAPKFGGSVTTVDALKWLAYSGTPGMIAGVLQLIPSLSLLSALAGFYGLFILLKGMPLMTGIPDEKKWPFLGSLIGAGIGIAIVLSILLRILSPGFAPQGFDGQIDLGRMGDALKHLEPPR